MIELYLIGLAVLLSGFGYYRLKRAEEAARRYLEGREQPLQLAHLTEALARVARETRTLRISLESPLQAVREFGRTDLTRTEGDLEGFDALMMDSTREVGQWLAMIDALAPHERQELEALGAGPETVRGILVASDWAFERAQIGASGKLPLDQRLEALLRELARIEAALQAQGRVYR